MHASVSYGKLFSKLEWRHLFTPSLSLLLLVNLLTAYVALTHHWSVLQLMWVYWAQSVILGVFYALNMLRLHAVAVDGVRFNGQPVEESSRVQTYAAAFFLVHYGLFHLVYLFFLYAFTATPQSVFGALGGVEWSEVVLFAGLFFAQCLLQYITWIPSSTYKPNIGSIMVFPYIRIIPMHLTITGAPLFGAAALPFFLVLKIIADVVMQLSEHALFADTNEAPESQRVAPAA